MKVYRKYGYKSEHLDFLEKNKIYSFINHTQRRLYIVNCILWSSEHTWLPMS